METRVGVEAEAPLDLLVGFSFEIIFPTDAETTEPIFTTRTQTMLRLDPPITSKVS